MNFAGSDRRIRELKEQFKRLSNSSNVDNFETNFAALISSGRGVTHALQADAGISFDKDGNIKNRGNIPGFADWYLLKQGEMRNDELIKYFKNVRDEDLHTGKSRIQSGYSIRGEVKLSASPGKVLQITNRGIFEVSGVGLASEEREQKALPSTAVEEYQISLEGAPNSHLNKPIGDNNPLALCALYKSYLENLVREAKEEFLNK